MTSLSLRFSVGPLTVKIEHANDGSGRIFMRARFAGQSPRPSHVLLAVKALGLNCDPEKLEIGSGPSYANTLLEHSAFEQGHGAAKSLLIAFGQLETQIEANYPQEPVESDDDDSDPDADDETDEGNPDGTLQ